VPAEHDRPEEAGELVHRIERRDLVVQPGLDLLEAAGFETPGRSLGISIVFIVLPALEVVPEALLFHRLYSRPRGAGDIPLAPALGHEAPTRLQSPRQSLEEAIVVRYPVERRRGEDQIHTLLDLERQQVLALNPNPRLAREPPPRRLDHRPRTVYCQHRPLGQLREQQLRHPTSPATRIDSSLVPARVQTLEDPYPPTGLRRGELLVLTCIPLASQDHTFLCNLKM
jgi:hypothetical protein